MNIQHELLQSFIKHKNNNALFVNKIYYTYGLLSQTSAYIAQTILNIQNTKQAVIIMGSKSFLHTLEY